MMKSFKQFLSEGLIKIDENLVKEISETVFEYTLRYIIYYYRNKDPDQLETIIKKIQKNIAEHNLPKYSSSLLYRDSSKLYDNYGLEFSFTDSNRKDVDLYLNFSDATQSGFYDWKSNFVQVNIKFMIASIIEDLYKTCDKYLSLIYSSILGLIKHELTHRTQFSHHHHPKQLKLYDMFRTDSKEAYYTSQVEFDPMIKSSIESIKTLKRLYPNDLNVIKYYTGQTDTKPKNFDLERGSFLPILKKRAPVRYKKALKYIFRNL